MAIHVIFEDVGLCDTANDDVLKQTGDIDTGLTWHEKSELRLSICQGRPLGAPEIKSAKLSKSRST
jgi:hypothetical protein